MARFESPPGPFQATSGLSLGNAPPTVRNRPGHSADPKRKLQRVVGPAAGTGYLHPDRSGGHHPAAIAYEQAEASGPDGVDHVEPQL